MLKKLLSPRGIFSLIFGALILVALLAFGDVKKALALMESFQLVYLLYFLLLMILYEALRVTVWHFLLTSLDIHVPLGEQIFTFLIGEVTKVLPIGNYVPDYLLQRFEGTDFGLASAATTLLVLIEVAVSLAGVVIIGIEGWNGWLRPLIIVGVAVFTLLVWALARWHHALRLPGWARKLGEHQLAQAAAGEVKRFIEGGEELLHARILAPAFLLGALYVMTGGSMLYMVVRGLGVGHISYAEALAVYFFSLAFSLIVPVPIDFGVTEVSGVGVLLVLGASRSDAVGVMLLYRVLSVATAVLITLAISLILHNELHAALHKRGRKSDTPKQQAATSQSAHDA